MNRLERIRTLMYDGRIEQARLLAQNQPLAAEYILHHHTQTSYVPTRTDAFCPSFNLATAWRETPLGMYGLHLGITETE